MCVIVAVIVAAVVAVAVVVVAVVVVAVVCSCAFVLPVCMPLLAVLLSVVGGAAAEPKRCTSAPNMNRRANYH